MKLIDILRRSASNLKQAKARTILTAAALAVGGFTLTVTLAAANGARAYTSQLISTNFNPNALIVSKDKTFGANGSVTSSPQLYSSSLVNVGRGQLVKELSSQDIAKLKSIPGVSKVLISYQMAAQYVTRAGQKKYTASLEAYDTTQKPSIVAGREPASLIHNQILLPKAYISLLGFGSPQVAIGQKIIIQVRQLRGATKDFTPTIIGVTTQPTSSISLAADNILLSTTDARNLYDFVNQGTVISNRFLTAIVDVRNGTNKNQMNKVKQAIQKAGYAAESVANTEQFINQIITILQSIILVFGVITLIASFFGVVNTQYISVLQRTREIGLMKALGMSRGQVSRLFILEATWIGFIGGLSGSVVAVIAGTLLNPFISKSINFGKENLLIFNYGQIGLLILFLMVVTAFAGFLPASKAARLDPIEALRTE